MKMFRLIMALLAVASFATLTLAKDEAKDITVTGKIVCAKCSLNKADAADCQNVIVATVDGKTVEYYLVNNKVSEEYGHVCKGEKAVVATGTVKEKDGKTWLEAEKMEQPKTS
jgi:type 1 fimbria pilin